MRAPYLLISAAVISLLSGIAGSAVTYELLGTRMQKNVRAQALEIVDADGMTRGRFGLDANHAVSIHLYSQHQEEELLLSAPFVADEAKNKWGSGGIIHVNNGLGQEAVLISTSENGDGVIDFESEKMPSGKMLLGHFGTDQRVDGPERIWGMSVGDSENRRINFGVLEVPHQKDRLIFPADPKRH